MSFGATHLTNNEQECSTGANKMTDLKNSTNRGKTYRVHARNENSKIMTANVHCVFFAKMTHFDVRTYTLSPNFKISASKLKKTWKYP
jgi:hypothetical protein